MESCINEEMVKRIFFYCDERREGALMADEVDIMQFAEMLEAVIRPIVATREHQRCVKIVSHMNREVACALENQRP
jgi:hypothetical protein